MSHVFCRCLLRSALMLVVSFAALFLFLFWPRRHFLPLFLFSASHSHLFLLTMQSSLLHDATSIQNEAIKFLSGQTSNPQPFSSSPKWSHLTQPNLILPLLLLTCKGANLLILIKYNLIWFYFICATNTYWQTNYCLWLCVCVGGSHVRTTSH